MKIISLMAENVKKLTAVTITPDGNLVQITGKNGQGKTSVLDSIWWALAGANHIQAAPIRTGATEARIRLDMGELIVTRTFKRKPAKDDDGKVIEGQFEPGATTSITVESAEGARFPSPQRVLDALLGELTFDPLAFARADAKEQVRTLRSLVAGIDFDEIDRLNAADYERRRDINRDAKNERAQAGPVDADAPSEPIDDAALVEKLEKAAQHNAEIETRKARREQAAAEIATATDTARRDRERAAELREQAKAMDAQAAQQAQHVAALQAKLDAAPALPEPVDVSALRQQIADAREHNAKVAAGRESARHTERAKALEAESAALTKAMEDRKAKVARAIAEAKLPVPGLGFDDAGITLDGVPFEQASDAEQLRASVAIAIAMNPKLRVIRIRDGSLLDEDAMTALAEMADAADVQVWVERVDGSGKVGFVLEDGHLKGAAPAVAAE